MARGRSSFRQQDVTRAVLAVRKAGEGVQRVEVGSDGKIIIVTAVSAATPSPSRNEWDED